MQEKIFSLFHSVPRKTLEASPAIAIQEPDMPWFIDLKDILTENKQNPHFDLMNISRTIQKSIR